MDLQLEKPLPQPTPVSRPFWEALDEERILVQHCSACDSWVFYPRSHCPHCLSDDLHWREVSGEGVLYTFTITRQPTAPFFADEVPQRIAVVELAEGIRLTSTLVGVVDEDIRIGMRLKPRFDRVADGITLLRYQPA